MVNGRTYVILKDEHISPIPIRSEFRPYIPNVGHGRTIEFECFSGQLLWPSRSSSSPIHCRLHAVRAVGIDMQSRAMDASREATLSCWYAFHSESLKFPVVSLVFRKPCATEYYLHGMIRDVLFFSQPNEAGLHTSRPAASWQNSQCAENQILVVFSSLRLSRVNDSLCCASCSFFTALRINLQERFDRIVILVTERLVSEGNSMAHISPPGILSLLFYAASNKPPSHEMIARRTYLHRE